MNMEKTFSHFLNYLVRALFLIIIIWSMRYLYKNWDSPKLFSISLIISLGLFISVFAWALKKEVNKKNLFLIIFFVGLIIRLLWFFNIDSVPISDFGIMYNSGKDFINGSYYMFWGTHYFARFPHMSLTVMFFGLVQQLFSNPLNAIRLLNIVFSMSSMVAIYFIAMRIFQSQNKGIFAMLFAAFYPPMILYNNVFCSENLAMPILLLSILMFLKSLDDGIKWFIVSGLLLGLTHLFRPMGYIMIIGYAMYILIYYKQGLKEKMLVLSSLVISFITPLVLTSAVLIDLGIIGYPLWYGTEPPSVSILKGTNISSLGRWNTEDAEFFGKFDEDYEKIDVEAKRIIKERLTQTPVKELAIFFVNKYGRQWMTGDFSGASWAEAGLDDLENRHKYLPNLYSNQSGMILRLSEIGFIYFQIFHILLLALILIGFYWKNTAGNKKVDLFYILYCGFAFQNLITESQDRYAYIASWIFVLLSITAFRDKDIKDNRRDWDKI